MNKPLLIGGLAVAIGLGGAAALLHFMNPMDRPLWLPGSWRELPKFEDTPPVIIPMGATGAAPRVHLALGDDPSLGQPAYRVFLATLEANPDLAGNVVPVAQPGTPANRAYAMVVAAPPEDRADLLDALMGSAGQITDSVLTVVAQNAGLDATVLRTKIETSEVQNVMGLADRVLPPGVPAINVDGEWLTGSDLTTGAVAEALKRSDGTVQNSPVPVMVENPHTFAMSPRAKVAAIFLTLRNPGTTDVTVTKLKSDVSPRIEFHETAIDAKGVMQMRKIENIVVPAGQSVELTPTGKHIMLFDVVSPFPMGMRFPVRIVLDNGQEISVLVEAVAPGKTENDEEKQGDDKSADPALTHEHHSE